MRKKKMEQLILILQLLQLHPINAYINALRQRANGGSKAGNVAQVM
jgi:hypothetical protein